MSWKWSTGLRDYVMGKGSFRDAFTDCKLMLYTSPIPTEADDVPTGTYLGTFTKSSDTTAAELLRGWGEIESETITDATAGRTYGFTCTGSLDGAVTTATYIVGAALAVKDVAVRCVRLFTDIGYNACATGSDGIIYIMAPNNQSMTIALAAGMTGAITPSAGIYPTDANSLLRFGAPSLASIAKDTGQTWSGVMFASGTAAYGRIVDINDTGADITTERRLQGTVGVGTGDIQITNANLTALATETVTTCAFTFPAE